MRAFIRDLKTGLFCARDLHWTAQRDEACDFGSTFHASAFAGDNHLQGVEVVLMSDKPADEVRIDLEREGRLLKFYGTRHGK